MAKHVHSAARPPRLAAWLASAALITLIPDGVHGQALQGHGSIRDAARAEALRIAGTTAPAQSRIAVEVSQLDPRLALPVCPAPLEALPPATRNAAARISVQVRCPVPGGWSLYVPVRLQIETEVLVLAAPAARGETLTAAHLRFEHRDVAQLAGGYLTRMDQAEQMMLRRPVAAGSVLTSTALELPKIVKRGQRVRVIAAAQGYSVASEGEALTDAAEGDRVRVRHVQSRRVVEGVVDPDGQVRVSG